MGMREGITANQFMDITMSVKEQCSFTQINTSAQRWGGARLCMCAVVYAWGGQRVVLVLSSTMWVLGIKLRSSGLAASTFTC